MLGYPRKVFTYLGPSDIGIWAYHTRHKTSLVKLVVLENQTYKREKETLEGSFFWGILVSFSRENIFSAAKHPTSTTGNPQMNQRFCPNSKEFVLNGFEEFVKLRRLIRVWHVRIVFP